jgi:hypothetical protein
MQKFKVTVRHTVAKTFYIDADNPRAACDIAHDQFDINSEENLTQYDVDTPYIGDFDSENNQWVKLCV